MTWKDLQKLTNQYSSPNNALDQLRGLPFWYWDKTEHKKEHEKTNGHCCFNHAIGLPMSKSGKHNPLFDYQQIIIDGLEKHKRILLNKAGGIGATELLLRYISWLCLKDDKYRNTQVIIITGPNKDLSIKLIKRMKKLFGPLGIFFEDKESLLTLGGVTVEAYPSNHIDAARSLPNVSFILGDECDFFKTDSDLVRAVIERYILKNNCMVALVSTPNSPGGLMDNLEREEPSLYHKLKIDYKYCIDKMFTQDEIREAQKSPSFEREFCCKFLGMVGNVFSQVDIDKAIEKSKEYANRPLNNYALHPCGVDWGFGSSKTVACLGEFDNEKEIIRVIRVKEWTHATPSQVADELFSWNYEISNILFFCDGSNRGSINELKRMFDENLEWENGTTLDPYHNKVLPVNFNKEHRQLLFHAYNLVSKGYVSISEKFDKLILALKTAQATDFSLDKNTSIENDYLDAFRLMLKGVIIEVDS